jgi:predicted nucleotidyltransferase
MKNKLKINLSGARFKNFKSMFNSLEKGLAALDIDFFILGALARDMHFSNESINTRTTADVDLAVYINSRDEELYQELRKKLIEKYDFVESKSNNLALTSKDGTTLDLLPFGELEVADGVIVSGQGLSSIRVNGFKEVHLNGLDEVDSDELGSFKVAKLSSIILLKLIAFDDRPEMRGNDPQDVASIISHYFDLNSEYIYENHQDLFEADKTTLENIASSVIGREIREVIAENERLNDRIIAILEDHISKADKSPFVLNMIGDFCNEIDTALIWMESILKGIKK